MATESENGGAADGYGIRAGTVELIKLEFTSSGFSPTVTRAEDLEYSTDEAGKKDFDKIIITNSITIFGQRGKWNRIGAYIVHVSLLTLFLGHFVANITGFDADVQMIPGDSSDKIQMIQIDLDKREKFDVQLPFTRLVRTSTEIDRSAGNIGVTNTMDWRTRWQIDDPDTGLSFRMFQ